MSRNGKRALGGTLTFVLLVAVAGAAFLWTRDASGSGTVRVERDDLTVRVEATGKLEAAVAYEIGPPSVRDFWQYNLSWMIPEKVASNCAPMKEMLRSASDPITPCSSSSRRRSIG